MNFVTQVSQHPLILVKKHLQSTSLLLVVIKEHTKSLNMKIESALIFNLLYRKYNSLKKKEEKGRCKKKSLLKWISILKAEIYNYPKNTTFLSIYR